MVDLVVIGSGPAGMTAAIYAARANKNVVVLEKEGHGGQMAQAPKIENFPGFQQIMGIDLATIIFDQMLDLGVQFELEEAREIKKESDGTFTIYSDHFTYHTKAIIIATGAQPIELKVPGAEELFGEGVHYCVVCDGPLYKDREVLVIGSGNTGAQYALELATYCSSVTICDMQNKMICEAVSRDKIVNTPNINTMLSVKVDHIVKDDRITVYFDNGNHITVDGIFVAMGQRPATDFVSGVLEKDNRGYILSDSLFTNVEGIFVAGDCRVKKIRQAITAAGDGAEAALMAIQYINNMDVNKGE